MSVTILQFHQFEQRLSPLFSMAAKAECYAVYCQALRESGLPYQLDASAPDPLPVNVSLYMHTQAKEKGYCYLYMFRDNRVAMLKSLLGPNPTLRNLLSYPAKWYSAVAIRSLRLSLFSNGVYHIGIEGSWSLPDAIAGFVVSGGFAGHFPKSTYGNPVDIGLSLNSRFGAVNIDSFRIFNSINDMSVDVVDSGFVGTRCKVYDHNDEVLCIGVVTALNQVVATQSKRSDVGLPKVVYNLAPDGYKLTLVSGICKVCRSYGIVDEHFAMCKLRTAVNLQPVDPNLSMNSFTMDLISAAGGREPNTELGFALLRKFYFWWVANGYLVSEPDVEYLNNHADDFFLQEYSGMFRVVFRRVFSDYLIHENFVEAFAQHVLPVEYIADVTTEVTSVETGGLFSLLLHPAPVSVVCGVVAAAHVLVLGSERVVSAVSSQTYHYFHFDRNTSYYYDMIDLYRSIEKIRSDIMVK